MLPDDRRARGPASVFNSVDLPGAVAAEQGDDFALAHVERGVVQDMALAVKCVDALEAQDRRGTRLRIIAAEMLDLGPRQSRINLLHPAVGAHRVGRAGHQHLALVHHGDGAREAKHAVDVVLDDQDRNMAAMFLTRFETRSRSAAARPASGSSSSKHLRLGAARDAEIDQPLPAIGEFAALDGLDAFEARN